MSRKSFFSVCKSEGVCEFGGASLSCATMSMGHKWGGEATKG